MGTINHGSDLPLHWNSAEEAMREEAGYAPFFSSFGKKVDYNTHLSPTMKDGEVHLSLSYQGHSSGYKTFPFSREGFEEAAQILRNRFSHKEPITDAELEEFWETAQEWVETQRSRYYEAMGGKFYISEKDRWCSDAKSVAYLIHDYFVDVMERDTRGQLAGDLMDIDLPDEDTLERKLQSLEEGQDLTITSNGDILSADKGHYSISRYVTIKREDRDLGEEDILPSAA